MTSEVVVMNKHAMVLAADSATTVRQFVEGEFKERYYKGANKIFELSAHHPVGLMLYDNSAVSGVPWEILAKSYRQSVGDRSFDTLKEYGSDLFDYITTHTDLFPTQQRVEEFIEYLETVAIIRCVDAFKDDASVKAVDTKDPDASDPAAVTAALTSYVTSELAAVQKKPVPSHFSDEDVAAAIEQHLERATEAISQKLEPLSQAKRFNIDTLDVTSLARLAVHDLFRNYSRYLSKTGIIICGYGDREYFPAHREYHCYGLLLDRFIVDHIREERISLTNVSDVRAFAQSSAVHTFMLGFGEDVYQAEQNQIRASLNGLAERIIRELELDEIPNISTHVDEIAETHIQELFRICMRDNHAPLHRVVGSLPIDEMTELAETLIHLESLKEKVTKTSEMVGGPIDVAAISKTDGFIWIKRKHYFAPELNRRFLLRQDQEYL